MRPGLASRVLCVVTFRPNTLHALLLFRVTLGVFTIFSTKHCGCLNRTTIKLIDALVATSRLSLVRVNNVGKTN